MRKETEDNVIIEVRVTPRSSRRALTVKDDTILVSVTAPPAEGKANKMVLELVAKWLGRPKSSLQIVGAEHHRQKLISIAGITQAELARKLKEKSDSG